MRNIKKGQTYPVYSVSTNRAFNRIQLLVQSWESKSHCMCHFLIILLLSNVIYFTIAIITSFYENAMTFLSYFLSYFSYTKYIWLYIWIFFVNIIIDIRNN